MSCMTDSKRIMFMERDEQDRCSLCQAPASLAKTSAGLLCATCVLRFLRKPHRAQQQGQHDRTEVESIRRGLASVAAFIPHSHPTA